MVFYEGLSYSTEGGIEAYIQSRSVHYVAWIQREGQERLVLYVATLKQGDATFDDAWARVRKCRDDASGGVSETCRLQSLHLLKTYEVGTSRDSSWSVGYEINPKQIGSEAEIQVKKGKDEIILIVRIDLTEPRIIGVQSENP